MNVLLIYRMWWKMISMFDLEEWMRDALQVYNHNKQTINDYKIIELIKEVQRLRKELQHNQKRDNTQQLMVEQCLADTKGKLRKLVYDVQCLVESV